MHKSGKKKNRSFHIYPLSGKDSRGLSEVVTNLILILLVLVAVGVIWVVIRNIISSGAGDIELGQFTFDLSIQSAYISGTDIVVGVKRNPGGGELIGMKFLFTNSTEILVVRKNVVLQELDQRTFTFNSAEIAGISAGDEVSIAPIYSSNQAEKSGNPTDSAKISGNPPAGGEGEVVCGNSICQPPGENSGNCLTDCPVPNSCDRSWTTTPPEDAGVQCDGTPIPNGCTNCVCNSGFTEDFAGGCILNSPVNIGIITSVWNNVFLDSNNLPKSDVVNSYIGDYANFSGSVENGCFLITFADYLVENDISYLRLDDSIGTPSINSGEGYSIWEAQNCGQ